MKTEKEKKIEAHTQVSMKAYDIGVIAGKAEAINREVNMQCLNCGVSLHREIMDKKIHIHLCKECRMKYLEEQTSGEMK